MRPPRTFGNREGVGSGRTPGDAKAGDVTREAVGQVGGELHLADPGRGLGVGDPAVRRLARLQADVAQAQVAQLADPQPGAGKHLDNRATAEVGARVRGPELR